MLLTFFSWRFMLCVEVLGPLGVQFCARWKRDLVSFLYIQIPVSQHPFFIDRSVFSATYISASLWKLGCFSYVSFYLGLFFFFYSIHHCAYLWARTVLFYYCGCVVYLEIRDFQLLVISSASFFSWKVRNRKPLTSLIRLILWPFFRHQKRGCFPEISP